MILIRIQTAGASDKENAHKLDGEIMKWQVVLVLNYLYGIQH